MRVRLQAQVAAGLMAALACFASVVPVAEASFPGRNGKIVYGWTGASGYRGGEAATSVRTVAPRSGRVRVLRDCPLVAGGITECRLWGPRYSPDGRRIAFPMIRIVPDPIRPWQYWPGFGTMASDGSGFEEHAPGNAYGALAWSPAGDRLLVQRTLAAPDSSRPPNYSQPNAIFLASLDGTELSQVTSEGTSMPDWSSTGEIAFTRASSDTSCFPACSDIYVMRPGGTPRRLTYRAGDSPSWSPHGTKLAFVRPVRIRPDFYGRDVYIVGRDGRGLRRLTRRGGSGPVWSPDGKRIAFVRDGDLYVVRATGGGLRRLVYAPKRDAFDLRIDQVTALDWQPLPRRKPFSP